nr:LLM class flavin-dependent oxidoreductase [Sphingobium nicotianae]
MNWDIGLIELADQIGIHEAWCAEHYTLGWENVCAPELVLAAASRTTKKIRLATGANLLPYHNPIALAHRLMQLDHMTGGRLIAGFGAGGYETDAQLFGLPDLAERREITQDARELIIDIWTRERPFRREGKHFKVDYPAFDSFWGGPNWRPMQLPHPPVAIAGISASSSSLKDAGRHGYIPMSFDLAPEYLIGHWDAYAAGAAESGLTPDRAKWRLFKNAFTGRTDEEALELALSEPVQRVYDEFVLRVYERFGLLGAFAPGVPEDQITAEFLARNVWLVGAPKTLVERIRAFHEEIGGFGVLVTPTFDFIGNPEPFKRHLKILGEQVGPELARIS